MIFLAALTITVNNFTQLIYMVSETPYSGFYNCSKSIESHTIEYSLNIL